MEKILQRTDIANTKGQQLTALEYKAFSFKFGDFRVSPSVAFGCLKAFVLRIV